MANSLNFISALLLEAQSTPFQITPSTMANIVKGLYTLRPGKKRKMFLGVSHTVVMIYFPKYVCGCCLSNAYLTNKCALCSVHHNA